MMTKPYPDLPGTEKEQRTAILEYLREEGDGKREYPESTRRIRMKKVVRRKLRVEERVNGRVESLTWTKARKHSWDAYLEGMHLHVERLDPIDPMADSGYRWRAQLKRSRYVATLLWDGVYSKMGLAKQAAEKVAREHVKE